MPNAMPNPDVDYDSLEQHTYDDAPGVVFYTCPRCGDGYSASLITNHRGEIMCAHCWSEVTGKPLQNFKLRWMV